MINNYEEAEVMEIGNAHDVILGSTKIWQLFDDAPYQVLRDEEMADDD